MSNVDALALDFEGNQIPARSSDTIASALLRAEVMTFSRGPKYHRPRGPFCFSGSCAQCHMRVNGEPNVPTCITPARDGLHIERQNVIGSGDTDLLRAVDFLYPDGIDHHHLMTGSRLLNEATKAIARRLAGIGEIPSQAAAPVPARTMQQSLVIIGAGPAGLAAARAAIESGHRPLVLEARGEVGGHVAEGFSDDPSMTSELLESWAEDIRRAGSIKTHARVVGLYAEGGRHYVVVKAAEGLWEIEAEHVIVATGGHERNLPFDSNDLPGVFGGRALLRLVRDHDVRPGKRVAILGAHRDATLVARGLHDMGVEVAGFVDLNGSLSSGGDSPHYRNATPVRATGHSAVRGLKVLTASGEEVTLFCDLIAVVAPPSPDYELAAEVGAHSHYRTEAGGFVIDADADGRTGLDWLLVAGAIAGASPIESGRRAGRSLRPLNVAVSG